MTKAPKVDVNTTREFASGYLSALNTCFNEATIPSIYKLYKMLARLRVERRRLFICGNGGSAANAIHIANDLHYGVGCMSDGSGIAVEALPANSSIITCLANDLGYEHIYSHQIEVKASPGDGILVLSGSGNSPNVINALLKSKDLQLETASIVAFGGGRCAEIADIVINVPTSDMQIAEDCQLIIGHICMRLFGVDHYN